MRRRLHAAARALEHGIGGFAVCVRIRLPHEPFSAQRRRGGGERRTQRSETIEDGRTGFLFDRPSVESFFGAICRAFATYSDRGTLNAMRREAMACSYSWDESAEAYARLYQRVAA